VIGEAQVSEAVYEEEHPGPSPAIGAVGAVVVAAAGLGVAFLGHYQLSLLTYVLVLVFGVAFISAYRYLSMRRTMSVRGYAVSRAGRRLALLPVAFVFLSCAANAFVWASEVAKR
jgi:purine-cytosine permease-like protein